MKMLYYLMDTDGSGELGFAEFILFVVVIKQIEHKVKESVEYQLKMGLKKKLSKENSSGKVRGQGVPKVGDWSEAACAW